jgi:hypothetical protein
LEKLTGSKVRGVFKWISFLFFTAFFSIIMYYTARVFLGIDDPTPVGESMVSTELPTISFPLAAKPITYAVFALVLGWVFLLESFRNRISRWKPDHKHLLFALIAFFAFLTGYETVFNFTIWGALMREGGNPDEIPSPYPNPQWPWNLNFATKIYSALFFLSIYTLIFLATTKGPPVT